MKIGRITGSVILLVGFLSQRVWAAEFDLSHPDPNASVTLLHAPDETTQPQIYIVHTKPADYSTHSEDVAVMGRKFIVIRAPKVDRAEVTLRDDDSIGHVGAGLGMGNKDTGYTFGIAVQATYSTGDDRYFVVKGSSDLFSKRTGQPSTRDSGNHVHVTEATTERERVSGKWIKFAGDSNAYYVVGVNAEYLTPNGPIARDMMLAWHRSNSLVKKTVSTVNGGGPEGAAASVSAGAGKELHWQAGNVSIDLIPQLVAQVGTDATHTQVQGSVQAAATYGPASATVYAEYDKCASVRTDCDANVVGARVDLMVSPKGARRRIGVFVALEKGIDEMRKDYAAGYKADHDYRFAAGLVYKFQGGGAHAAMSRSSGLN